MDLAHCFSADYAGARERFLAAAGRRGARLESHVFAARGPAGEVLHLDAARLGDAAAPTLVVASSGLHGVEGFFGSAVQLAWLDSGAALPPGAGLLLLHALNPYGFAALRRWNEHNVDLNRNFLAERSFLARDPAYREIREVYARLQGFLNPPTPPSRWEPFAARALLRMLAQGLAARRRLGRRAPGLHRPGAILELGLAELRKALPVGQYEHPQGLFYGGAEEEETTRLLRRHFPRWAAGAQRVLHLDFHTGLGPYGHCKLLVTEPEGSAAEAQLSREFGAEAVEPWGGRGRARQTAYPAHGIMTGDLGRHLPGVRYDGLTAEFGTYSALRVLAALRAENRAHFHADPGSPIHAWAKARLREAFCPADPRWRRTVVEQGLALLGRALALAARPDQAG